VVALYQFFDDPIDKGARPVARENHTIAKLNLSGIQTTVGYTEENDSSMNSVNIGFAKIENPVHMSPDEARMLLAALKVSIDQAEGNH
jgi:septation ring formation regulator EzrA